jgi:hypothetical protein
MIFSTEYIVESEKERNLYAKFFAGYFFNEFALNNSVLSSRAVGSRP